MNDTIIGVVVGGLIAWITPLLALRYGERRWKAEALLNVMKADRDRMEQLYERALRLFADGMVTNSYSTNMIADFMVLMPKDIYDLFIEHMKDKDKSEPKSKSAYLEIAAAMKRDLRARDEEMRGLLRN